MSCGAYYNGIGFKIRGANVMVSDLRNISEWWQTKWDNEP